MVKKNIYNYQKNKNNINKLNFKKIYKLILIRFKYKNKKIYNNLIILNNKQMIFNNKLINQVVKI